MRIETPLTVSAGATPMAGEGVEAILLGLPEDGGESELVRFKFDPEPTATVLRRVAGDVLAVHASTKYAASIFAFWSEEGIRVSPIERRRDRTNSPLLLESTLLGFVSRDGVTEVTWLAKQEGAGKLSVHSAHVAP